MTGKNEKKRKKCFLHEGKENDDDRRYHLLTLKDIKNNNNSNKTVKRLK